MSFDLYCRDSGSESFSRNNWGWSLLCDGLIEYGAIGERIPRDRRPKWPSRPGDEHFDDNDEPVDDIGRAYAASLEQHLAWKPDGTVLPPWHKFDDNSGWIVTAAERAAMLEAIAVRGQPESSAGLNSSTWPEFLNFLIYCANHEGFEVR